jgi:hypothetical protein
MIDPLVGIRLVQEAYATAFLATGVIPDLSRYGLAAQGTIYGPEGDFSVPYGFLLEVMANGDQVIVLRGTNSIWEWLEDGQIHMHTNPWGPGLVHGGFSDICGALGIGQQRTPIIDAITNLSRLTIVGHSLGAAVGRQLCAKLGHVGAIYTWGEPRSCNGDAAGYALNCATVSRRARNPRDLVPKVPVFDPCRLFDGYRHAGDPILLAAVGSDPIDAHSVTTYISLECPSPCPTKT